MSGRKRAVLHRHVAPADDAVAPQQRQRVVPELPLRHRRVGLEAVRPAPQHLEAPPVPDDRIERRQQADLIVHRCGARALGRWPIPVHALHTRVRETTSRALQRSPQLASPLRNGVTQPSYQHRQARRWQRRVLADDDVHERVEVRGACRGIARSRRDARARRRCGSPPLAVSRAATPDSASHPSGGSSRSRTRPSS